MELKRVIGLDLGTTHVKAAAMDEQGAVLATSQRALSLESPHAGWAQQDAGSVADAAVAVLREVGETLGKAGVAAVALSGAMHSLLAVDERDAPIGGAMTWADARADDDVDRTVDASHYAVTGCPAHASFHPARLRWWSRQSDRPRVRQFVALKDFVLHTLTGTWVTDRCLASTTGLLDTHRGQWHEPALRACGVTPDELPDLCDSTTVVGTLHAAAAERTGLPRDTPIVAGGSDGTLANLGATGAVGDERSCVVITVGTSGAMRWNVNSPRLDDQQRTWCYRAPLPGWVAGGAINSAGLAVQWIADRFYSDESDPFAALMADAATVAPGSNGLILLPYFSGERAPHYRGDLTASLLGLSLQHERRHIARAALESVALCLAQVWHVLATPAQEVILTGGITRQPVWMRILADVLGVTLRPMTGLDASTRGSAVLAFHTLGVTLPPPALDEPMSPDGASHRRYRDLLARFIDAQAVTGSRR